MRKIIFIIFFLITTTILEAIVPSTREIIILCDCNGENIARTLENPSSSSTTMCSEFVDALYQQAAPILVTGSIVDHVLAHKEIASSDDATIQAKYGKYLSFNSLDKIKEFKKKLTAQRLDSIETAFYIFCANAPFDKYIIFKIENPKNKNALLYLLIPNAYLANRKITLENLGLKTTYPRVTIADIKTQSTEENCDTNFVGQLPAIFITKPTINTDFGDTYPYIWAIYMSGHGSFSQESINRIPAQIQSRAEQVKKLETWTKHLEDFKRTRDTANIAIAQSNLDIFKSNIAIVDKNISNMTNSAVIVGMEMANFKKFLQFLNTRIITTLLVYTSCSAGGQNFVDAYKSTISGQEESLNYTVATAALTEAASTQMTRYTLSNPPKNSSSLHFATFFEELRKDPQPSLAKILSEVIEFNSSDMIGNVPLVRLAGASWSNTTDIDKTMFSLTNVKAIAQGTNPLTIANRNAILITPEKVNFPLIINKGTGNAPFPSLISQRPGQSFHIFSEIKTNSTLGEIVKGFFPLRLTSAKLFIIKKLQYNNSTAQDVLLFNNVPLNQDGGLFYKNGIIATIGSTVQGLTWPGGWPMPEVILQKQPLFAEQKKAVLDYFKVPTGSLAVGQDFGAQLLGAPNKKINLSALDNLVVPTGAKKPGTPTTPLKQPALPKVDLGIIKSQLSNLAQSLHLVSQKIRKK